MKNLVIIILLAISVKNIYLHCELDGERIVTSCGKETIKLNCCFGNIFITDAYYDTSCGKAKSNTSCNSLYFLTTVRNNCNNETSCDIAFTEETPDEESCVNKKQSTIEFSCINVFNKTVNNSINGSWSECSPWKYCVMVKSRRDLSNSSNIETVKENVSCSLICNYHLCNEILIDRRLINLNLRRTGRNNDNKRSSS
jgi:hypothetical protein